MQLLLILNNESPYQLLFDKIPNLSHIRVFGCLAYASTLVSHTKTLDPRSRKCAFLGYRDEKSLYYLI